MPSETDSAPIWQPLECAAREKCRACWQVNAVGFSVPDEVWHMAVPEQLKYGVLCLNCFTTFADERGVLWDRDIEFFPVSRITACEPIREEANHGP